MARLKLVGDYVVPEAKINNGSLGRDAMARLKQN